MKKRLVVALAMGISISVMVGMANASIIWPMQVGQDWVYEVNEYPSGNSMADAHRHVTEKVTINSQQFFHFYDTYFRSTDTEIWEYDFDLGDETLFFQIAPEGTTWSHGTNNTVEIVDTNFQVDIPYGLGIYSAYKLKFYDYDDRWNMYIVPGLGLVQMDEIGQTPANIMKLKSINPIPIPGAVWLLSSGLIGIVGFRKKFKKISLKFPLDAPHYKGIKGMSI